MGIVRNSINVEGLTQEEDLPIKNNGQLIRYSEVETLIIPRENPEAKNIYEIGIDLVINSNRMVRAPSGKLVIFDGVKSYKIIYTEKSSNDTACITEIHVPYNTFIELPMEIDSILDVHVYIIDAYFQLLNSRRIYAHFVYMLDVQYDHKQVITSSSKTINTFQPLASEEMNINTPSLPSENYDEISASNASYTDQIQNSLIDIDEEIL